jgi:hypothetical protein
MDRRRFRSPNDIERDRLMRLTPEALNLKISITSVECIAERGRRLSWPLKGEHAFVPGFASEAVGNLARLSGPFG